MLYLTACELFYVFWNFWSLWCIGCILRGNFIVSGCAGGFRLCDTGLQRIFGIEVCGRWWWGRFGFGFWFGFSLRFRCCFSRCFDLKRRATRLGLLTVLFGVVGRNGSWLAGYCRRLGVVGLFVVFLGFLVDLNGGETEDFRRDLGRRNWMGNEGEKRGFDSE